MYDTGAGPTAPGDDTPQTVLPGYPQMPGYSAMPGYSQMPVYPQPPMFWPESPAPVRRTSRWLIPAVTFFVLVLVGCVGMAVVGVIHASDRAKTLAAEAPQSRRPLVLPGARGDVPTLDTGPAANGPQASDYPVGEADDLDRVCDGWYYPQSPKFAGNGLHPVVALLNDRKDSDQLTAQSFFDETFEKSGEVQNAWDVKDAKKAQLVACIRLAGIGSQVRTCKFDDPKPEKLPLKRATYKLELFEVATGRKLVTKALKGDDQDCPFVAFIGTDRTVYASVSEKSMVSVLKPYVQKK